jgi:hypothetical protein
LPVRGGLFFRADGRAAFVNRLIDASSNADAVAVEIATGRIAAISGLAPEPSVLIGR